jgi:hypothetical protein
VIADVDHQQEAEANRQEQGQLVDLIHLGADVAQDGVGPAKPLKSVWSLRESQML